MEMAGGELCCRGDVIEKTGLLLSGVSSFGVTLVSDNLSETCWMANSLQTHGVLSSQKPQSKVSKEPPGSNRLVLPLEIKSNMLPRTFPPPCVRTDVSLGGGRIGIGEKLV